MGVIWRDYSIQSDHLKNPYKTTTHLTNIAILLYYYYIRHKVTTYEQQIETLCLGRGITYGSILPIVTEMVVWALCRNLYHTKVQNLVVFLVFNPLNLVEIESSIFTMSTSE